MKSLLKLIEYKTEKKGKELAELLGVSVVHLSRLRNKKNKEHEKLVRYVKEFGLSWKDIGEALERDNER